MQLLTQNSMKNLAWISVAAFLSLLIFFNFSIPPEYFRATKLLNKGLLTLKSVIDSSYTFDQAEEAFKRACAPDSYRVVVFHKKNNYK